VIGYTLDSSNTKKIKKGEVEMNKKVEVKTITKNNKKGEVKMVKFTSEMIQEAHTMAKELKNQYKDVDYQTQFGLCMAHLLEIEKYKNVEFVTFEQWYHEDYLKNQKQYSYWLYNSNILDKNQRLSDVSTEGIARDTQVSMNYQILNGQLEDVQNDILIKVMEYFTKHQKLPYMWRKSMYTKIANNILKRYRNHLSRFKAYPENGYHEDKLILHNYPDEPDILSMDIQNVTTEQQFQIMEYLKLEYSDQEISDIIGLSRQYIHRLRVQVQKRIVDSGLREVYGY